MGATGRTSDGRKHAVTVEHVQFASWPTCNAADGTGGGQAKRALMPKPGGGVRSNLVDHVQMAARGTPTCRDATDRKDQGAVGIQGLLGRQVWLAAWGTPTAGGYGGTPEQALARKEGLACGQSVTLVEHQAQLILHELPAGRYVIRASATGCSAEMANGGQLDPEHSRWQMGYPAEWGSCGGSAMQSCRRSRRSLSRRTSKHAEGGE